MTKANALGIGTIVRLKSGGPEMTIRRFTNEADTHVACQWFAGKKLEDGVFPVESLDLVKPEAKGA